MNSEKIKNKPGFNEWESDYYRMDRKSARKQSVFFRHLTLVASSMFGILISLHDTASQPQCIRLVFLCAIVLLALGILFSVIALYGLSTIDENLRKELLKSAFDNVCDGKGYRPESVKVENRKVNQVFQKCSLLLFVLSILLLTYYTILIY